MHRFKNFNLITMFCQLAVAVYFIFVLVTEGYDNVIVTLIVLATFEFALMALQYFYSIKFDNDLTWYADKLEDARTIVYRTRKNTEFVINDLPIGIVNINDGFEVTWANDNFKNYIKEDDCINKFLKDLSEELYNKVFEGQKNFQLQMNGYYFDCIYDQAFKSIVLEDNTNYYKYKNKYNNSRLAIGIIKFDDYDELMSNKDVQETTEVQGKYYSIVAEYASKFKMGLKSISDDSFLLIMDQECLRKLIDDKLSVLELIRNLNNVLDIKITASIGISSHDIAYDEIQSKTNEAVILAERRGGDQAIIDIEGEEIMYIGGTVEAAEKRSKVKARILAGKISHLIDEADQVFITGHDRADADSIGSVMGISSIVNSRGKECYTIVEYDNIDKTAKRMYDYYSGNNPEEFTDNETARKAFDPYQKSLVFVLDCNSENLVGIKDFVQNVDKVVVIDHHRRNTYTYSDAEIQYIEAYASSTCELVAELIRFTKPKIEISTETAVCMYCGILVDTINFSNKTGSRTFEVAAYLRTNGADNVSARNILRDNEDEIREVNELVNSFDLYNGKFAFVVNDNIHSNITLAKVSNKLLEINGVEASFTIAKLSDEIYGISARSLGEVNVQIIMEYMGGGGHLTLSACQRKADSAEELKAIIMDYLKEME